MVYIGVLALVSPNLVLLFLELDIILHCHFGYVCEQNLKLTKYNRLSAESQTVLNYDLKTAYTASLRFEQGDTRFEGYLQIYPIIPVSSLF